jgi:hypothetical protein
LKQQVQLGLDAVKLIGQIVLGNRRRVTTQIGDLHTKNLGQAIPVRGTR